MVRRTSGTSVAVVLAALMATLTPAAARAQLVPQAGTPFATGGTNPVSIATGDVDGDGNVDAVVVNQASNTISVLRGDGAGSFTAFGSPIPTAPGVSPTRVVLANLGGSAALDLAVLNGSTRTIQVYAGAGDGTFSAQGSPLTVAATGAPVGLAAADFDGDGDVDLAATDNSSQSVVPFRNDGSFAFVAGTPVATGQTSVGRITAGDLTGDGKPELVVSDAGGTTVRVLTNNGSGAFTAGGSVTVPAGPEGSAIGDVDGDGHADVVVASRVVDTVSVLRNDGNGTLSLAAADKHAIAAVGGQQANPGDTALADIDNDGDLDIAVADPDTNAITVLRNDGHGGFTEDPRSPFATSAPKPLQLAFAQAAGDSLPDLLATELGTGGNGVLDLLRNDYAPELNLQGSAVTLDANVGDEVVAELTLTNGGEGPLSITSFAIDPAGDPWSVADPHGCKSTPIAGGQTCTVEVHYKPAAAGESDVHLHVVSNGGSGDIELIGKATAPPATTTQPTPTPTPTTQPTQVAPAPVGIPAFKVSFPSLTTTVGQATELAVDVLPSSGQYTYSWDYDNDGIYDVSNDAHSRTDLKIFEPGSYTVGVLVTRVSDGVQQLSSAVVTVNPLPIPKSEVVPDTVSVGKPFVVDITAPDAPGARYRFDFGDGSAPAISRIGDYDYKNLDVSLSGRRVHTYRKAGTYEATFSVLTASGQTVTYSRTYVVGGARARAAATTTTPKPGGSTTAPPTNGPAVVANSSKVQVKQIGTAISDPPKGYSLGDAQAVQFQVTGPYGAQRPTNSNTGHTLPAQFIALQGRTGDWQKMPGDFQASSDKAKGLAPATIAGFAGGAAHRRGVGEFTTEFVPNGYTTWTFSDEPGKVYTETGSVLEHTFHTAKDVTVTVVWHVKMEWPPGDKTHDGETYQRQFTVRVRPPLCGQFNVNYKLDGKTAPGACLLPTDQDLEYNLNGGSITVGGVRYSGGLLSGFYPIGSTVPRFATISRGLITGSVSQNGLSGTILATTSLLFPPLGAGSDGLLITKNALEQNDMVNSLRASLIRVHMPVPDYLKSTAQAEAVGKLYSFSPQFDHIPVIGVSAIKLTPTGYNDARTDLDVALKLPEPFSVRQQHISTGGGATARAAKTPPTCAESDSDYLRQTDNGFDMCIKSVSVVPGLISAKDVSLSSGTETGGDGQTHDVLHGGGAVSVQLGPASGTLNAAEKYADGRHYGFKITDGALTYIGGKLEDSEIPIGPVDLFKLGAVVENGPGGRFLFQGDAGIGFPSGFNIITVDACVQIQRALKGDLVNVCGKGNQPEALYNKNVKDGYFPLSDAKAFYAKQDETGFFFDGSVRVLGIPIANGYLYLVVRDNQGWYVQVGGSAHFGIPYVLDIKAAFDGQADYNPKGHASVGLPNTDLTVQLFAEADGCLFTVICTGVQVLANNKVFSVCLNIFIFHVGARVGFMSGTIGVFGGFGGCDLKGSSDALPANVRAAPFEPRVDQGMAAFVPQQRDEGSLLRAGTTTVQSTAIAVGDRGCYRVDADPKATSTVFVTRSHGGPVAPIVRAALFTALGPVKSVEEVESTSVGENDDEGDLTITRTTDKAHGENGAEQELQFSPGGRGNGDLRQYGIDGGSRDANIIEIHHPQKYKQICIRNLGGYFQGYYPIPVDTIVRADAVPGSSVKYELVKVGTTSVPVAKLAALRPLRKVRFTTRVTLGVGEAVTYVSVDKSGRQQLIGRLAGPPLSRSFRDAEAQAAAPTTLQAEKTIQHTFAFVPEDSVPGKRTIWAYETRYDNPLTPLKLGSYIAARTVYERPGRVIARRARGGVSVNWLPAPDATGYRVTIRRGRAVSTVDLPATVRHYGIGLLGPTQTATVGVAAVNFRGQATKPRTTLVRATKRLPKSIVVLDGKHTRKPRA